MLPDYHIHTLFCKHAEGEMAEYLRSAVRRRLPEICFTDHVPNPDNYDQEHRMKVEEFPRYRQMVRGLAASGAPAVLFGLEADYYPGCEKFLKKFLPAHDLDLVIGSIHYIEDWGFDNPEEREVWDNVDVADTWRKYFDLVGRLAETRLFDVVGHFDLPKKFGFSPGAAKIREMVGPVLEKIAGAGMAIELNTSGLRKPVKEIYPSLMLLEMARGRDIPVCFGSDAHRPGEVGCEFAAALALAKKAGYSEAVRFKGRRKTKYDLP